MTPGADKIFDLGAQLERTTHAWMRTALGLPTEAAQPRVLPTGPVAEQAGIIRHILGRPGESPSPEQRQASDASDSEPLCTTGHNSPARFPTSRPEAPSKGRTMAPRTNSAALNIQPRQRREVYHALGKVPAGRSVKDLLTDVDMPEHDLRESLRRLDAAGLAQRNRGTWMAMSSDGGDPEISPN